MELTDTAPEVFKAVPPDALYHYTSCAGILGILTNKEIWMSAVSSLNDAKETGHARDVLGYVLAKILGEIGAGTDIELAQIRSILTERFSSSVGLGVCSFSLVGNSLAQWRLYADDGRGVALYIRSSEISAASAKNGIKFGRCIYARRVQETICERFVRECLLEEFDASEIVSALLTYDLEIRHPKFDQVWTSISYFIVEIGIFMKHDCFVSEGEWRCVTSRLDRYRATQNSIVPFGVLSLVDLFDNQRESTRQLFGLTIGPKSRREPTFQSLFAIVSSSTGRRFGISRCDLPYV